MNERRIANKSTLKASADMQEYVISRSVSEPLPGADWQDPFWSPAETLELTHFRPEGSGHRPRTFARLLYDENGIHGIFQVHDQYVRCTRTNFQDEVWKDSCVEFFVQPKQGCGYFNFEFNCGGAFLCYYIVNPERTADGFKEFTKVPEEIGRTIQVWPSLPGRIREEIKEPVVWTLRFFIPFSLFEHYPLGKLSSQAWRGNFYKCADESSHPHWGSWTPLDAFDFHRPSCFGRIRFAQPGNHP
jgi:hypothetical protein